MAFVKKTWKDRIAEFPTRRRLTKEDNTSELVTVAREEGTLSQEGDAFSAENMNDLENRIDAEFTELNGKLNINNIVITFPTELGASIISKNVMCMMNGIIYIDILFQLSNEVGNGGTVFSLMNGSSAITFNKRLDMFCYGNKMYSIVLIPNTNYFVANGFNIPAGNYKFTAIIDNN